MQSKPKKDEVFRWEQPFLPTGQILASTQSTLQESNSSSLIVLMMLGPSACISIDPATNRTYHYWHVFVPGVKAGQIYGYRVNGAFDPPSGMRFDPAKVLLDPYGRGAVVPKNYSRDAAR